MSSQLDILEKEKDGAISAAGAFANPEWMEAAESAIRALCRKGREFTADDVWSLLQHSEATTPEPRALGSVMRQFIKDGLIYPTGRYRKSVRRESHRRPLAVWVPSQRGRSI